jgi:hypothetical protein
MMQTKFSDDDYAMTVRRSGKPATGEVQAELFFIAALDFQLPTGAHGLKF